MNDAGLNDCQRPHALDYAGQSFQPVADEEEHVAYPRFFKSTSTLL